MEITKDTKLKDIQAAYPTILEELKKEEPRVEFFETFAGKMLLKKATVGSVADMANVPVELLIQGLEETIAKLEGGEE
ncbi:MAG: hypothetical protein ACSW8G_00510 [Bacillota bacterium]